MCVIEGLTIGMDYSAADSLPPLPACRFGRRPPD